MVLLLGACAFAALIFLVERAKASASARLVVRINNERGLLLDSELEKRQGERLTERQRKIISSSIGLYHWVPEELHEAWEERILTFVDSFSFFSMDGKRVTDERKLLVAAEACLLIVKRRLSDYRHLKRINLWKNKIGGTDHAGGTATKEEVNLSWRYLMRNIENPRDGQNLILHEFAHVIDFADDGIAQSIPVSPHSSDYDDWKRLVDEEHAQLMAVYESGKNYAIRAYGGYESMQGDKPEIFSCATSAFFERCSRLRRETPRIHSMLKKFYGVDPANWRKQKS